MDERWYSSYPLPSNPACTTEDPLSICEEYNEQLEVPKWALIRALLERDVESIEALFDIMSSLQHNLEFATLRSVMEDKGFMDLSEFFKKTYPSMVQLALRMPELFPSGELDVLKPGESPHCTLTFTREQVGCLLVHMFLCTFSSPPKWNRFWANFGVWYNSKSQPTIAYIKSLLNYFGQIHTIAAPNAPKETITFHRKNLTSPPDWSSSATPISTAVTIATDPGHTPKTDDAEVVFANKDISFGTSGTQEEAKLAMSPETCIIVLLAPTLSDTEAISIRGAKRFGSYEGIGREVRFSGTCIETHDWNNRSLIAMDALEIDLESDWSVSSELEEKYMQRELNKAFCGFTSHDLGTPYVSIATGHWGCGSFGGNKYVKALVQLMAASEAKSSLHFRDVPAKPCSHDPSSGSCDPDLKAHDTKSDFEQHFTALLIQLERSKVTVGQLYQALQNTRKPYELNHPVDGNIFAVIPSSLQTINKLISQ